MNTEQASKVVMRKPTRRLAGEGRRRRGRRTTDALDDSAGVVVTACLYMGDERNTGNLVGWLGERPGQPQYREIRSGPFKVADEAVVLMKSGNADGGKGPLSGRSVLTERATGDWQ